MPAETEETAKRKIEKIVEVCERGLRTAFSTGLDPSESAHMVMKHVLAIARRKEVPC